MPIKDREARLAYKKAQSQVARDERRAFAYSYLGGKCSQCGSKRDLEIDHIDPRLKSKGVAHMWTDSQERFMTELAKCQLLCHECHVTKTLLQQGRGVLFRGVWYQSKRAAMRECHVSWMTVCGEAVPMVGVV